MPNPELISTHMDEPSGLSVMGMLRTVINQLKPLTHDLNEEERQKYGSINEKAKLIVGKVMDYQTNYPELASPEVNWAFFKQHWTTRTNLANIEEACYLIIEMCSDPRILHDYVLFQNSLTDYDYTKYRAGNASNDGGVFTRKLDELRQFFPTGGGNTPTPPPAEE